MVEKWSKLADASASNKHNNTNINPPATTTATTMVLSSCANAVMGTGSEILGKGQGYLEVALEEAEKTRRELAEENGRLRRWAVTAVNDVQAVLHLARGLVSVSGVENNLEEVSTRLFPC